MELDVEKEHKNAKSSRSLPETIDGASECEGPQTSSPRNMLQKQISHVLTEKHHQRPMTANMLRRCAHLEKRTSALPTRTPAAPPLLSKLQRRGQNFMCPHPYINPPPRRIGHNDQTRMEALSHRREHRARRMCTPVTHVCEELPNDAPNIWWHATGPQPPVEQPHHRAEHAHLSFGNWEHLHMPRRLDHTRFSCGSAPSACSMSRPARTLRRARTNQHRPSGERFSCSACEHAVKLSRAFVVHMHHWKSQSKTPRRACHHSAQSGL